MIIQGALNRLAQVLQDAQGCYFGDLQHWLFNDSYNAMGIRRKSKEIPILFWWDIEGCEFEKMQGLIKAGGELYQYHFSVDDLLANDWECVLMDADGDFKETFDDFLRNENDEVIYLNEVMDLGFFRLLREKIINIEILCPYTSEVFTQAQKVLKEYHNQKITGKIDKDLKEQWESIVERNADRLISIDWEAEV